MAPSDASLSSIQSPTMNNSGRLREHCACRSLPSSPTPSTLQKTQGSSKITKLPITEKLRVTMRTSTSTHGPTGSRPKIPYTIISSPQSPNKQNAPVARYERRGILSYLVGLYGEAGVVAANEYFQSLANKWLRCKVCGRRPRRDFREQDTSAFECKVRFCLRSFRHR